MFFARMSSIGTEPVKLWVGEQGVRLADGLDFFIVPFSQRPGLEGMNRVPPKHDRGRYPVGPDWTVWNWFFLSLISLEGTHPGEPRYG